VTAPIRAGLRLWELFVLSFALQCGMLALLAFDFHRVSLAGPLSNVPAVFLTGLIVPLGFLTLGATFLWSRLAHFLAALLGTLVKLLLASTHWFAALPHVSYRIPEPPAWLMIVWLPALVALCGCARMNCIPRAHRAIAGNAPASRSVTPGRIGEWIAAAAFAAITIAAATHPFRPGLEAGKLEVTVLDVGQGDSIFAAFPDGGTMLIDGGGEAGSEPIGGYRSGPDIGEEVVAPYLWSRGIKRIDVVALTHAHHDHLDGLHAVLNDFRVGQLWVGSDVDTKAYEELIAQARSDGIPVVHRYEGAKFSFSGTQGDVLWPRDSGELAATANNNSLVVRLNDGGTRFLLPGDIEQKAEKQLIADGAPLAADFLKVPHHGSKTSSTEGFLDEVAPRVAVISVAEQNAYGQPSAEIVERYRRRGVRLLQTNRDGAVTASTDGSVLRVTTYREMFADN